MTKTFDKKDIFSWFNYEKAEPYIKKKGYFANGYSKDLKDWNYGELAEICPDNAINKIFLSHENIQEKSCHCVYGLFLPIDKVKDIKEEKKYRPFLDVYEFLKYFKLGDIIHLKKCHESFEITGIFTSYYILPEYSKIVVGGIFFPFNDLPTMNNFQIEINDKWQPFGIEE